jgi:hypothetical protein
MAKLHRAQMNSAERQRAREARRDDGGVVGKDGVVSYFHQWRGDVETPSAVQMQRGIDDEDSTFHHVPAVQRKPK